VRLDEELGDDGRADLLRRVGKFFAETPEFLSPFQVLPLIFELSVN
jgi:hypothetical protein